MGSGSICAVISGGAVTAMLLVAHDEFRHGAPPGEIHLITSIALATGSSVANTGAGYHASAIIEAIYRQPAASSPLPLDGVTTPTT